jgi:hypothetical protein
MCIAASADLHDTFSLTFRDYCRRKYLTVNVGCHFPMSLLEKVLFFFTFDSVEQCFSSLYIAVHFSSIQKSRPTL